MPMEVNLDAVTRERLEEQSGLAVKNIRGRICLRHSINQIYGEAVGILLEENPAN